LLEVHVEARHGVEPAQVETIIAEEVAAFGGSHAATRQAGRDAARAAVSKAAAKARRAALLDRDSAAAWADAIGAMTLVRGDPHDLERHIEALGAVDATDVQRVVGRYLVPEGRTTVRLVPATPASEVAP
ncbi:MAG: hypothetical protein VX265_17710, partial [Myxococcota bacterium]|nr:hypothetical protein [Myxococcota bacterium]